MSVEGSRVVETTRQLQRHTERRCLLI